MGCDTLSRRTPRDLVTYFVAHGWTKACVPWSLFVTVPNLGVVVKLMRMLQVLLISDGRKAKIVVFHRLLRFSTLRNRHVVDRYK